jgi:anti-sigma-K factor RskA
MNTPLNDDESSLRYAEYVLGVLDAAERAAVERELVTSEEAQRGVAFWQERLTPMTQMLPQITPSEEVWTGIRRALGWDTRVAPPQAARFWSNARPWQWISLAASVIAIAFAVLFLRGPVRETGHLLVSSIRQNGVADWTATVDLDRKQVILVPAATAAIPSGRSTQLWLIPAGQSPISVGVFVPETTNVLPLSATLLARLATTAILAVSVEPPGGSPTGQPTGPVIATGPLSGVPAASGSG